MEALSAKVETLTAHDIRTTADDRLEAVSRIVNSEDREESEEKWKSAAQLAADTSALEAQAAVAQMKLLSQQVRGHTSTDPPPNLTHPV
jgi:hypothetical protein